VITLSQVGRVVTFFRVTQKETASSQASFSNELSESKAGSLDF